MFKDHKAQHQGRQEVEDYRPAKFHITRVARGDGKSKFAELLAKNDANTRAR